MKDSSLIKEVVWEDGNLFVRLKSGKFYEYADVPEEVYLDFIDADSLGKFFGENIKDQYEFTAFVEPEVKTKPVAAPWPFPNGGGTKGGTANLPKAWQFPTSESMAKKSDLSGAASWPFPTGNKP